MNLCPTPPPPKLTAYMDKSKSDSESEQVFTIQV